MNYKELNKEIKKRDYNNIEGLKAEITEDEYWYFLEVLPPLMIGKGFFLNEPLTHTDTGVLHHYFWQQGNKFFCEIKDRKKYIPDEEMIRAGMM